MTLKKIGEALFTIGLVAIGAVMYIGYTGLFFAGLSNIGYLLSHDTVAVFGIFILGSGWLIITGAMLCIISLDTHEKRSTQ